MSAPTRSDPLRSLAAFYGLETSHVDGLGRRVKVAAPALHSLLRTLGAGLSLEPGAPELEAAAFDRVRQLAALRTEPVVVVWDGEALRLPLFDTEPERAGPLAWRLVLEGGGELRGEVLASGLEDSALDRGRLTLIPEADPLPHGYHRLTLESSAWREGPSEVTVLAAPVTAFSPPGRSWGAFLPLHALHSGSSWGIGDLTDLGRLTRWAGALGAEAIGSLPLLPAFLDRPFEPSPYAPLSRRFWNEVYLDPRALPGFERSAAARRLAESSEFDAEMSALRAGPLVDYRGVMAAKRRVCAVLAGEALSADGVEAEAVRRFAAERPLAASYAAFRAVNDRLGSGWPAWPEPLRSGRVEPGDCDPADSWLHLWTQWALDFQMGELGEEAKRSGVRLYLDFPVGVHAGGFDVWQDRDLFALGASAGAPPDSLFVGGQDWGLPPLLPERLRARGYDYWIESLRHHLRHAGMLRIDHVMQLHRLYWIPAGFPASQGAYVRQPADEMLAILCIESRRHGTVVVGENLGTVPPATGEALRRHSLLGMYVRQFDLHADRPPADPDPGSVASLNTHDTPTFRGFCEGRDLDDLHDLGLYDAARFEAAKAERELVVAALGDREEPELLRGQLEDLAASPARWLMVNLEDLWGEGEPQNVPGTSTERPNWRRKAALTLEEMEADSDLHSALRRIDALRRDKVLADDATDSDTAQDDVTGES